MTEKLAKRFKHGIRVSYYNMLHELEIYNESAAPNLYLEELGSHLSVSHLRHCFDYLRRVLMCAADTNLEAVNPETDSITGWGSLRQCRDFEGVVDWASQWKNSSSGGID